MNFDLMALAMKSMGFDPVQLTAQASSIGATFAGLQTAQAEAVQLLRTLQANQLALMGHLGMTVPPLDEATEAYVAEQTKQALAPFGGAAYPADVAALEEAPPIVAVQPRYPHEAIG